MESSRPVPTRWPWPSRRRRLSAFYASSLDPSSKSNHARRPRQNPQKQIINKKKRTRFKSAPLRNHPLALVGGASKTPRNQGSLTRTVASTSGEPFPKEFHHRIPYPKTSCSHSQSRHSIGGLAVDIHETLRVGQQPSLIALSADHASWVMGKFVLAKTGLRLVSRLCTAMYVNEE